MPFHNAKTIRSEKISGSRRTAPVEGQTMGLERPDPTAVKRPQDRVKQQPSQTPAAKPGHNVNTGNIYRVIRGHGVGACMSAGEPSR